VGGLLSPLKDFALVFLIDVVSFLTTQHHTKHQKQKILNTLLEAAAKQGKQLQ
jgi:hypothetical protein